MQIDSLPLFKTQLCRVGYFEGSGNSRASIKTTSFFMTASRFKIDDTAAEWLSNR